MRRSSIQEEKPLISKLLGWRLSKTRKLIMFYYKQSKCSRGFEKLRIWMKLKEQSYKLLNCQKFENLVATTDSFNILPKREKACLLSLLIWFCLFFPELELLDIAKILKEIADVTIWDNSQQSVRVWIKFQLLGRHYTFHIKRPKTNNA